MIKIHSILVEKAVRSSPQVDRILKRFPETEIFEIDDYELWWSRVKKPYLKKREKLNLILAAKKGELVKLAPDAYGLSGEPHYYYVHAYNCIYECEYCYLQGYFQNPDLVLFLNHQEILASMQKTLDQHAANLGRVWFHAGEFSDSLALSHLSGELPIYHEFVLKNPRAVIELRTKSVQVSEILKLEPCERWITSFSLSPSENAKSLDRGTPSLDVRLKAMKRLSQAGHALAAHFDPIVYTADFSERYSELIQHLEAEGLLQALQYVSLGVVRFTKSSFEQVLQNYPESLIHQGVLQKEGGDKVKYSAARRAKILNQVEQHLLSHGYPKEKIYWCME